MKMTFQVRYGNHHQERFQQINEQTASTSKASEQGWLMIGLGLMGLVIALYWFSERYNEQPAWVYQPVIQTQPTVEQPVRFELSDPMTTSAENPTIPTLSPHEQLVRRFYSEVINQQQWVTVDELFATEITYGPPGSMIRLNLTELKQLLQAESAYYAERTYSIRRVVVREDLIGVHWSAQGMPLISSAGYLSAIERQTWSGYTIWKVKDGKIVQMGSTLNPKF